MKYLTSFFFLVLCLAFSASPALAQPVNGTLSLNDGRKIFYRTVAPKPGMPTLLLANGLIYDLDNWNDFIRFSEAKGYGVIQFAYSTQPESLRLHQKRSPGFLDRGLELKDFVEEFHAVYRASQITGPVELVTLSYGSIAAEFARQYPQLVRRIIVFAPLVVPSDRYDPNGKLLHFWMDGWRNAARWFDPMGLWSPYWYDAAWDIIYGNYLRQRMDARHAADPRYVPSGVNAEDYKKAVFHMVRAARDFDLRNYAKRDALPPAHLMLASMEEEPALADQLAFWEQLPARKQLTITLFEPAHHALVGSKPRESFAWMDQMLDSRTSPRPGAAFIVRTGSNPVSEQLSYPQLKQRIGVPATPEVQQRSTH